MNQHDQTIQPTTPPPAESAAPAEAPVSASTIIKRLGPASILAGIALAFPPLGGILVLSFMDTIAKWLESHLEAGPWIYGLAFAVFTGLALLPTYSQSILGGWAFGISIGFPAALAGFTGGALIGYVLDTRVAGQRVVTLIDENPKWAAVRDALLPDAAHGRHRGFWRTLAIVILLRLPPNSPFALTNLLLASVRVPFAIYLLGTAIGMAPRTFAAVWLGHTLHQQFSSIREGLAAPKPWWLLAVGIVMVIIVLGVIGAIANKAIERVTKKDPKEG